MINNKESTSPAQSLVWELVKWSDLQFAPLSHSYTPFAETLGKVSDLLFDVRYFYLRLRVNLVWALDIQLEGIDSCLGEVVLVEDGQPCEFTLGEGE